MKKIFLIFWYVGVLLILFLIFEFGVRWIAGDRINFQGTSGSLYRENVYRHSPAWKPGATGISFGQKIRINQLGLRGSDIPLSDTSKILLLIGDSVLFGVGVPDSSIISRFLQKKLDSEGWTVLNTGVIGYRVEDYLNVAKYWLKKYPVKSVILFYALNDIYQQEPAIEQHRQVSLLENMLSYLRTHSKGYVWLKEMLLNRGKQYFLYDYKIYQKDRQKIDKAVEKLRMINKLCEDNNSKLTVLLLPSKYQYLNVVEHPWLPQKRLMSKLTNKNINVYDFSKVFQEQRNVDQFYLFGDGMHFSARGHREIANYVLSKVNFPE